MFTDRKKSFWIEEATLSPSAQIPPHTHRDAWELNWTKRGSGVRTLGGSTEPFVCGDVVLTPPRVRHFWDFRPWKKDFCTYCIFIRERWMTELQKAIPSLAPALAPLLQSTDSIVSHGDLNARARQILGKLGGKSEPEQALDIIGLLLMFARSTSDAQRIRHPKALSPEVRERERLRLYFVCNYTRKIRLEDAAREFGKSRSGFCDYVKRLTGKTLVECLIETRLEKACELLTTTAASVSEIAAQVGFADAAYFSRLFTREKRMSPLAWRRRDDGSVNI